ncbi:hypothetical protein PROFUN_00398 [Planoprotostelium fungivorum]|uniref:COX assembly mitochondrial protein n=1 Tax=Planoprotostelium fungivorum TaxID=1890364 RepID=A0A2P6NYA3_9EUKA|nr:hypothetical protein PROFUN_00398 [Planoprotostelium fungivorum]
MSTQTHTSEAEQRRLDQTVTGLKKFELEQLRSAMNKEALKRCGTEIEGFSACSTGRTFTVPWACKNEYATLLNCINSFASSGKFEEYKVEYSRQKLRMIDQYQESPAK